jgi:hypothetical protein
VLASIRAGTQLDPIIEMIFESKNARIVLSFRDYDIGVRFLHFLLFIVVDCILVYSSGGAESQNW